ncbi:MAG: serine hydrolase, partial [Bacteroidales bacterium]
MFRGCAIKRKYIAPVFIVPVAGFVLLVYFLLFREQPAYPDAISEKLSEADSIIKTMTVEEKINRILVVEPPRPATSFSFLAKKNVTPAGAFCINSSNAEFFSFPEELKNSGIGLPPLFFFRENDYIYPVSEDRLGESPVKSQLLTLRDSSLQRRAIAYAANSVQEYGVDVWIVPSAQVLQQEKAVYSLFSDHNILIAAPAGPETLKNPRAMHPDILFLQRDTLLDDNGETMYTSTYMRENSGFYGIIVAPMPGEDLPAIVCNAEADLFYVGKNYAEAKQQIRQLLKQKKISEDELDRRLRKVLALTLHIKERKEKLKEKRNTNEDKKQDSLQDIYRKRHVFDQVRRESQVLLSNPGKILPLDDPELNVNVFHKGRAFSAFNLQFSDYADCKFQPFNGERIKKQNTGKLVCITIDGEDFGREELQTFISHLDSQTMNNPVVAVLFDRFFSLSKVPENIALLQVMDTSPDDQRYAAQALFAGQGIQGRVPEYIDIKGYHYKNIPKTRLGYAQPCVVNLDTGILNKIDSIVNEAIKKHAFPGCQVFFAWKGDVVFNKCYGHHTYQRKTKVKHTDVYDLASITKVAATTLAVMHMVQKGKIDIHSPLGDYFKDTSIEYSRIKPDTIIRIDTFRLKDLLQDQRELKAQDTVMLNDSTFVLTDTLFYKNTPEKNIFKCTIRDMLIHKSGLPPSLPILPYLLYREDTVLPVPMEFVITPDSVLKVDTLENRKDSLNYQYLKYYNRNYIKDTSDRRIAADMYLRNAYCDTLWKYIKETRVYSRDVYMYSDLNPVLIQLAIDSINKQPLHNYVYRHFYKPLGLKDMGFKPLLRLDKARIVPTEKDIFWRGCLLHGDVHDPSAALMGGVAGNAGLFSSARDLGLLFQMLLQNGTYGRRNFLSPNLVRRFVAKQKRSHRGLGFDRVAGKNISAASAPRNTFGHTGFTGTCAWADPENQIVFVFLSNRVHPKASNQNINGLKVRQKV